MNLRVYITRRFFIFEPMTLRVFLAFIIFLTLTSLKSEEKHILFFEGDFSEALQHAKLVERPVFIDFYADWCAPCVHMEETAFSDSTFYTNINNNFVPVRVNVEYFAGMDIAEKYRVTTYPTLIILDKRGKEKSRLTGSQTATNLIQFIAPFH